MALAGIIITIVCLGGLFLGFASLGSVALRALRTEMASDVGHLLVSVATGLIFTEILIFFVQMTNHIRLGVVVVLLFLAGTLLGERKSMYSRVRGALRSATPTSTLGKLLFASIVLVASVEFLVAMAPLTGSDAMQYHFTVQKQILDQGFLPIFSNTHSFLCGQHHLLILLGLALGSQKLAMGLIFLGGILTASTIAHLISRSATYDTAAAFSLLFLLTPVIFWQISASGAPDIYMAYLACVGIIVLTESNAAQWAQVVLAGLLAGGIAGSKYTGCVIAAAFFVAVGFEFRSMRLAAMFLLAAFGSGGWPYLRNLVWTGNPLFPFLSASLSPGLVTTYALRDLANDTGAATAHHVSEIVPFLFLASLQKQSLGFYDFFGPTVFALSPMALLAWNDRRAWRIPLLIWILSAVGIFFASGLPRFLLPIYPSALLFAAGGIQATSQAKWRAGRIAALAVVAVTVAAGAAGLAIYSYKPVLASVGILSKTKYLEQTSPEYEVIENVNRLLGGRACPQKALVFIRHTYYLDIPYLNGNPGTSFEVNPDHLQTAQEWKELFSKQGVGYVIRSPDYPPTIAASLTEMERSGDLQPIGQADVEDFQGKRTDQERTTIRVVILKVKR